MLHAHGACNCPRCQQLRQRQTIQSILNEYAPSAVMSTTQFSVVAAIGDTRQEDAEEISLRGQAMMEEFKANGFKTHHYPSNFTPHVLLCILLQSGVDARDAGSHLN